MLVIAKMYERHGDEHAWSKSVRRTIYKLPFYSQFSSGTNHGLWFRNYLVTIEDIQIRLRSTISVGIFSCKRQANSSQPQHRLRCYSLLDFVIGMPNTASDSHNFSIESTSIIFKFVCKVF